MAKNIEATRKNSSKLTGGSKFITTPDIARLFVTVDKQKLKILKKCAIDFEIEVDDVLELAVDVLISEYGKLDAAVIEKMGREVFFKSVSQDD